jgi:hypothetical protein
MMENFVQTGTKIVLQQVEQRLDESLESKLDKQKETK